MAGLDSTGLTIKRQPEVLTNIETSERELISPDINTQDDELLGQLNSIVSSQLADLWALSEAVNNNFNILMAEGFNLDWLAAMTGLTRKPSTTSVTDKQLFSGDEGTNILTSSILENPNTGDRFLTTSEITLGVVSCYSGGLVVQVVQDNTTYSLVVNSTTYEYTTGAGATTQEVLDGLKAVIDLDTSALWTASTDVDTLTLVSNNITAEIAITGLTFLLPSKASRIASAAAEEPGSISAPANSVVTPITVISGLDSTTNLEAYVLGNDIETDDEFRARILVSQQASGKATVEALIDNIAAITEVESVSVMENNTLLTVDGIPAKAFEAVVLGATDAEVAEVIWNTKAAGIEAFGNTTVQVEDSQGNPQSISFTRPESLHIAFRVTYTLYDEEAFPIDGEELIKQALKDTMDTYQVGEDIIPTRFYGPIYAATDGIAQLTVEVQVLAASGDTPSGSAWSEDTIEVDNKQIGVNEVVDNYVVGP